MILQRHLPFDPSEHRRLPGITPLDPADWLMVDDAYAAQMAERTRLIETRRDDVIRLAPRAREAAAELLDMVLEHLPEGFVARGAHVTRPDGVHLSLDRDDPLATLGRLVQEDLCLLQPGPEGHVLTGAVLCFPASWRLDEKYLRPLPDIHIPVAAYDADIARRVQRLFDAIRPERPLWRCNALWYDDPALFQPRRSDDQRPVSTPGASPYFRTERQCLLRLPRTEAVVFSIHTFVLARADLPGHLRAPA